MIIINIVEDIVNIKRVYLMAGLSLFVLSACSSYEPSVSAAEAAAASRSVDILNSSPSYAPAQYGGVPRPAARKAAYQPASASSAQISVQDKLDVNVFKVPDLSAKSLVVETNGAISLPLIGMVKVAGLSLSQAENKITQKLKQYMQDPKVSITRTDKAVLNRVTVEGEVKTPGVYPIKGNLSFLQAIAMAQGLSEVANSRTVLFYRDGSRHVINLDLVRTGQIADPVLRGDDRIVVLKDRAKVREKKIIDYLPAVTAPISILGGVL